MAKEAHSEPRVNPIATEEPQPEKSNSGGTSGSGSGTQSASDDFETSNNQYDFEQIFEDQALSKEEEELFNQLKARETPVTEDVTPPVEERKEDGQEVVP